MLDRPDFRAYLSSLAEHAYSIERMFHRSIQVESIFDLFQQTLEAGVIGVDSDGTIFACNSKAEAILEVSPNDLLDRKARKSLPFLPFEECFEDRKAIRSRLVEISGSPVNVRDRKSVV